jgi:hypothetical protein
MSRLGLVDVSKKPLATTLYLARQSHFSRHGIASTIELTVPRSRYKCDQLCECSHVALDCLLSQWCFEGSVVEVVAGSWRRQPRVIE